MLKKLFSRQINSITMAAVMVGFSSTLSRFLGIIRDRILAGEFGAGDALDIYYAAFRIPDLLFNMLVLGALSAGFIPIITGLIKQREGDKKLLIFGKENKEAWNLVSNLLNLMTLVLFVLSVAGIIFASPLTSLLAPGFSPEKQALTANLTRIMFLSPIFLGISSVFGGVLQSFKRFFVYSLAPIMYNVGIIIGAIFFVDRFGIYGLAMGVVLGAFMHMLIQMPAVIKLGYKYKFFIDLKSKKLREIGKLMVPRTMSLAISQINLVVITIIASTLAGGSLAVFNFANNIQSFPIGVFGISFAVAAFPTLSAYAFKKKKLINNFSKVFRQVLFFIVPSTVLLLTLRAQIIRILLGTGRFDWEDTELTLYTLGYFSLSLFAQATIPLLIRVFYARHNSKSPFVIGLISAVINIFLSLVLSKSMGVYGLAIAFSVASIINFILLWVVLKIELGYMDEYKILISAIKFSIAALICGIVVQKTKELIGAAIDIDKLWGILIQGVFSAGFGIFAYAAVCSLLKSEELSGFWNSIKRRIPWNKINTGDHGEARGI